MAFDFLGAINTMSPLVKLISEIGGRNKQAKVIRQTNVPTTAETQSDALLQALIDPNNPLLATLTAQDRETGLNDFQSQIRTMQQADRREGAMGRQGTFFNPERADEAVSFLTSRGIPQVGAMARETAMQRILNAATGKRQLMPAQQGRQAMQRNLGVGMASEGSQIPSQILDLLRGLGSQQQQPMNRYVNAPAQQVFGNIHWG